MFELPVLTRPPRLKHSFSRISTFAEQCELRYALDAVMPRTPSSPEQARGTHVHAMAEAVARELCREPPSGLTAALEAGAAVAGPIEGDTKDLYLSRLAVFFAAHLPQRGSIEFWVDALRAPDGRDAQKFLARPWCGKVDLVAVDGEGQLICDFKTVSGPRNMKTASQAQRSLQLGSYCLATGQKRAAFVYLHPYHDLTVVKVKFSDGELNKMFDRLVVYCRTAEKRWETGGWSVAPPDHPLCSSKWCPWWSSCGGTGKGVAELVAGL